MLVSRGASNFKIEKLKVNLNEPTFDFIIHLPKLEFKGKYDLKVRIVLVDLAGKGDIYGVLGMLFVMVLKFTLIFFSIHRGLQSTRETPWKEIPKGRPNIHSFRQDSNEDSNRKEQNRIEESFR
jgi:hypothetical protein